MLMISSSNQLSDRSWVRLCLGHDAPNALTSDPQFRQVIMSHTLSALSNISPSFPHLVNQFSAVRHTAHFLRASDIPFRYDRTHNGNHDDLYQKSTTDLFPSNHACPKALSRALSHALGGIGHVERQVRSSLGSSSLNELSPVCEIRTEA
jgi:hypothetical protein